MGRLSTKCIGLTRGVLDQRGELVLGAEEAVDAAHQPAQAPRSTSLAAAEVDRGSAASGGRCRVAVVVRELDVSTDGAVLVGAGRGSQVHDYMIGVYCTSGRAVSC